MQEQQLQLYTEAEHFNMNAMFTLANSCNTNEYEFKISKVIEQIFSNDFNIDIHVMQNHKYLQQILKILSNIPQLQEINKHRVVIPDFEEIEVMKTDSAEIKKFIRKANYDFLGFHCNHKTIDKNYEKFDALIADIYSSPEFVEYRRIYREIGGFIHKITEFDNDSDAHYVEDTEYNAKKLVELIIKINSKIISANSTLIKECSKCKATVKKYNYVIKEVQRMREEYNEQLMPAVDNQPAESTYSILQFLNDEFPTVDRFPLSDVKSRYKQKFGLSLTQQEMKTKIEETNIFTVTCCKRKYFVNRK